MKARKVDGLDPDGPLDENARRIVRVRLAELVSFSDAIADPTDVAALHDMRIAAKRLRYVLELMEPVLGEEAKQGAKAANRIQDLLGEIHDCDEFLPRVESHVDRLRAEDAAALREAAAEDAPDLDPVAARDAPNRRRYRGLETLHAYLGARRDVLYRRFVREWSQLRSDGFVENVESA